MTDLGRKAPSFSLPDVLTHKNVTLNQFSDKKALLVMFICKHCPYVIHVKPELIRLAGGTAVLSPEGEYSVRVPWEQLRATAPEVLVIATLAGSAAAQSPRPPINTVNELEAALLDCWVPPPIEQSRPGMQITVLMSFKRNGELF